MRGTERDRLVDVGRTSPSRHFTIDVATACSRWKGLRHTAPPVAECTPSRAEGNYMELFKKVCSQFLPCMNAGVSLESSIKLALSFPPKGSVNQNPPKQPSSQLHRCPQSVLNRQRLRISYCSSCDNISDQTEIIISRPNNTATVNSYFVHNY